jgi:hypothetical protein
LRRRSNAKYSLAIRSTSLRHGFRHSRLQELLKRGLRNNNALPESYGWYISAPNRVVGRAAAQTYHLSGFLDREHKRFSWLSQNVKLLCDHSALKIAAVNQRRSMFLLAHSYLSGYSLCVGPISAE